MLGRAKVVLPPQPVALIGKIEAWPAKTDTWTCPFFGHRPQCESGGRKMSPPEEKDLTRSHGILQSAFCNPRATAEEDEDNDNFLTSRTRICLTRVFWDGMHMLLRTWLSCVGFSAPACSMVYVNPWRSFTQGADGSDRPHQLGPQMAFHSRNFLGSKDSYLWLDACWRRMRGALRADCRRHSDCRRSHSL